MTEQEIKTLHLHQRAGFGLRPGELADWSKKKILEQVEQLYKESQTITLLSTVGSASDPDDPKSMSDTEKREARMKQKEQVRQLNIDWMNKLSSGKEKLRERLTLFWHNHFACRTERAVLAQQLNNVIRQNALGKFSDLLLAVSKSPAMLLFLNNQQNKKQHPNENFARELLELFTIGRGNYTEEDIREAARAFTGWSFDRGSGDFQVKSNLHDDGSKTFMGESGNFGGEDIIRIVLKKKETARFIAAKIYRYLVNETPDESTIQKLASEYFKSDYDTGALVQSILKADWFYDEKNRGVKIKSPVELICGIRYQFQLSYNKPEADLFFQRTLGQILFYPPNVAGWPGGQNWIDSRSVMYRMRLASILISDGEINFDSKDDMPEDFMKSSEDQTLTAPEDQKLDKAQMLTPSIPPAPRKIRKVSTVINWDEYWKSVPASWTKDDWISFLLRPKLQEPVKKLLVDYSDGTKKDFLTQLLSLPEYQML